MYSSVQSEEVSAERERLILEHLPQVRLIARRIHERLPASVSLDDLVSSGVIGLIAAIDNFDPGQNVKLRTYAEHKIRGAILDSLRGLDWAPREKRRKARQIEVAITAVEQRLRRTATGEEIASELGVGLEEYHGWLSDVRGLTLNSFEYGAENESGHSVLDVVPDDEERWPSRLFESAELERVLAEAIQDIPVVERDVLSLYYKEELTLREIAQVMKVHLSRISQLKSQAILRLRAHMAKRWPRQRGR
jgi:RNA polymerase sigma factor for flagellar operon FliA